MKPDEIDQMRANLRHSMPAFAHAFVRKRAREDSSSTFVALFGACCAQELLADGRSDGREEPSRNATVAVWCRVGCERRARRTATRLSSSALGRRTASALSTRPAFRKKGTKSAGVKRQYSGRLGSIEGTVRFGVFLTYRGRRGDTFLDRRLYPPDEWCQDWQRRLEARVPDEVVFQTQFQLAIQMLEHALARGVPMEWVTGGTRFTGTTAASRPGSAGRKKKYVLAVSANTRSLARAAAVVAPGARVGRDDPGKSDAWRMKPQHGARLGGGRCLGISGMEATGGGARRKGPPPLRLGASAYLRETWGRARRRPGCWRGAPSPTRRSWPMTCSMPRVVS